MGQVPDTSVNFSFEDSTNTDEVLDASIQSCLKSLDLEPEVPDGDCSVCLCDWNEIKMSGKNSFRGFPKKRTVCGFGT